MKQKLHSLLLAVCAITFIIGCSKDDETVSNPVSGNGGEAFQAQLVTVNFPEVILSEYEYQGTLGGSPVTLTRTEQHKLVFMMPAALAPGNYDLVIPALSNTTVSYEVKETALTATADATVADFVSNLQTFSNLLNDSPEAEAVQHTIDSFNTYWAAAGTAEKNEIAIVYKANKALFDSILLEDVAGRVIVAGTEIHITKHVAAVALIGLGIATLAGAPVVGCVVIAAAAYKAYEANADAVEHIFNTVTVKVNSWFGLNDRHTNTDDFILDSNIASTFSLNLMERKLIASDAGKTEPLAVKYFDSYKLYNHYVDEANPVIENTNEVKGTDYSDINPEQLPASSPQFETAVTPEIYSHLQFSFSHPNVSLVSASVSNEGQLSIKAKITGNPASLPIQTDLHYSYSDGFSTFTGRIPVTVRPSVIGTWTLQSFENGTPVGTYFNYDFASDCSTLATAGYTITNETYTIGESTYTYSGNEITRQYNLSWTGCTVLSDGPDIDQSFPYSGSGTYTIDGDSYIAVEGGETVTLSFQWLSPDKIKIDDKVFTRN